MEDNFELEKVTAFDMLAHAMICVHEAAQAGGKVDLLDVENMNIGFVDNCIIGDVFDEKFLAVFGEVEPWPEDDILSEEQMAKMTHNFTLNENGWKLAKQIDMMLTAMEGIVPSQEQVDKWVKDLYSERKKR